ncbi:hypothetical protein K8P03_05065 [Anaerococcus murdochii]|uniref:Uncharacterized protein n=1 Tax=Anaerococcus murdochii TaxID=411577 RepID=A0ABS7SYQ9_9FIRM|nr:hypothetical protein [Anaerococcus murdochii]MBZ2386668.1 hypothetical protein [Anaerococcus murdochii]
MRYVYARKSRHFNGDAYLKKGFVMASRNQDLDGSKYYDLLVYDKKLKDEEVKEWGFEYIGEFTE